MATSAVFAATLTFTGDIQQTQPIAAAVNAASPATESLVNLASGANTLTAPVSAVATRLTIIPPAGNTILMTLKGVTGDTGVPLHKTDPTTLGIDATLVTLCLTAASAIAGVRLIWS